MAQAGCVTQGKVRHQTQVELRIAYAQSLPGTVPIHVPGIPGLVYVEPFPILTRMDTVDLDIVEDKLGPAVRLILTPVAAVRLTDATASHIGERMVLFINGEPVAAPIIREAITQQTIIIASKLERSRLESLIKRSL